MKMTWLNVVHEKKSFVPVEMVLFLMALLVMVVLLLLVYAAAMSWEPDSHKALLKAAGS